MLTNGKFLAGVILFPFPQKRQKEDYAWHNYTMCTHGLPYILVRVYNYKLLVIENTGKTLMIQYD